LVKFINAELGDEGLEFYASLEDYAYQTGTNFMQRTELEDRFTQIQDDALKGIGPYGESHLEYLTPFPLFELTSTHMDRKEWLTLAAWKIFNGSGKNRIALQVGEKDLGEAFVHYIRERGANQLPEIISRTNNNVLWVTHLGLIETVQTCWGFERRWDDIDYLSG
jgi:hypothetical protein